MLEAAKLVKNLHQRGFINSISISRDFTYKKLSKPTTLYCGFDPTGSSLHVGNLLQIMCLAHFQKAGHRPIALIGGATALIGDPSGRNTERPLLTEEQVSLNSQGIVESISNILDFSPSSKNSALLLNNHDWFKNMNLLHFMRDYGKLFKVQNMIAKDSVKSRLNDSFGISFTEFSYQLFQSYDFYHLYESQNCTLQIGGSDQWGNITSGIDLIHKFHKPINHSSSSSLTDNSIVDDLHISQSDFNPDSFLSSSINNEQNLYEANAFGLTLPLLTTSDGKKIGKSVVNQKDSTIWLHPSKTSPYDFYQYFMNVKDDDVIRFLKFFTFLSIEEIEEIEKKHLVQKELRVAQSKLAEEITRIVHGDEGLRHAMFVFSLLSFYLFLITYFSF